MKIQLQSQEVKLHIPPYTWKKFRQAMLNARQDREEVIGFLFCQRHQLAKNKFRYTPVSWIVPTPDCYERQSTIDLVLKQSFHQYILDNYLGNTEENYSSVKKLDVVHIHTHFGNERPLFSATDDLHEAKYAQFLANAYPHKPRLISGVFDELLEQSEFRLWDRKGVYHTPIQFYNSWFAPVDEIEVSNRKESEEDSNLMQKELENSLRSLFTPKKPIFTTQNKTNNNSLASEQTEEIFARQRVFGNRVQQQLGQIKVALIGCGGIGSVFAEQLARLGVKNWLLIDPDRLETVNLNRMPGATQQMVDQWWDKVNYVKWLIKRAYSIGSHVKTLPLFIEDKAVKAEIATADLIVVATDNQRSRQVAQELAIQHTLPLVCLGTHIEVKPNNQPSLYARVTVPPLGGDWCLMCGNIINLQQAALETASTEMTEMAEKAGYLQGVDDPAVYWLNGICASTGVGIIHGILSGFVDADSGLDWIYDFANANWLKTNTEELHTEDCYFCASGVSPHNDKEVTNYYQSYILG